MSVANETRNKVSAISATVGAAPTSRTTPVPTRTPDSSSRPATNTQTSPTTVVDQAVNPSSDLQTNPSDMKVNPEERLDFLVNEQRTRNLSPEESEELNNLLQNQKKNVGDIKRAKDKKENEANLDPIKIEQGDIIDYMMKEIILASAGWAGGKICGITGYYLIYKPASIFYHKLTDKDKEGAKATGTSGNTAYKKYEIKDSDDKTTAFTKTVGLALTKKIEKIETASALNTANLQTLLNAAIDNKLGEPIKLLNPNTHQEEEYQSLSDALKTIPMVDEQQTAQLLQSFNQLAQNNPKRLNELKQQAQSTAQTLINHQTAQRVFEEQYATAMMIQNMQKDPQYLGIQDPKALTDAEKTRIQNEKNLHKGNAKLLFARMYAEYHRNPPTALTQKLKQEYSSFSEFVGITSVALEHAKKTTERGQYVEKGKNPEEKRNILRQNKENPNEALDHLNKIMGIKKPEQNSATQQTTMLQATQTMQSFETTDLDRNITALQAELADNNQKRKRVQEVKTKAKNKSAYQASQSTISPTQAALHVAHSRGGGHV